MPSQAASVPVVVLRPHEQDIPGSRATEPRLPGKRLAAFAAIGVPIAGAGLPLAVYLPAFYATEFGLSLTLIGLILMLGRTWDTISDPLIGAMSDRTQSRFGRRRPWIAAGGALFAVASAALYFPPASIGPVYLGAALFFFYLGWTMIQIPALAWSGELSAHYHERTRIATYQQVTHASALLLVLVLPTLVDQLRPGDGRLKIAVMGAFILVTLLPALVFTLKAFPERPASTRPKQPLGFRVMSTLILKDALLMRVLASDFAVTLGQTIRGTLFMFFVAYYMGLPQWASGLFLFQFAFGVFAAPIWLRIGYRIGKHRTALLGELAQVAINLGLLWVTPQTLPLLLGLTLAQGLAQGSGNLMLRSIVADVADKHRLDAGVDRTGLYYSVFSLSGKGATAVAAGVALPLIAWLGFDPKGNNDAAVLESLKWVFALGPAVAHLLSAALIHGFPLDEARHREIRTALEQSEPNGIRSLTRVHT
jgi:glycoside/pentoside/hexuronide:cation symporter, GPH family